MSNVISILNHQQNHAINWEKLIRSSNNKKNHFLLMLTPLMEHVYQTLSKNLNQYTHIQSWIETSLLSEHIVQHFQQGILFMIIRSAVLEMHFAKENKILEGDTSEKRFDDFIEKLQIPKNATDFLNKYAVLKEQIDINISQFIHVTNELFERLNNDKSILLEQFFTDHQNIKLTKINTAGDTHQQGHGVATLEFSANNKKINLLYKPHSLSIDVAFLKFIEWFNQHSTTTQLKTIHIINQNDYGWCEFIDHEPCLSEQEVHQFYYRLGVWLMLIYLFRGYDFHGENLIAHGAHPVAVDFECLMTPAYSFTKNNDDQLSRFLVSNTGFLPAKHSTGKDDKGIDLSAIGSEPGDEFSYSAISWEDIGKDTMHATRKRYTMPGFLNKPYLINQTIDYMDYENDFTQGFVDTYELLLKYKSELLSEHSPLNVFKNARVRIVMRLTRYYAELLAESWHPKLLYSKKERDQYFHEAFEDSNKGRSYKALIQSELTDLNQYNIPVFSTFTDGHTIFNSFGKRLPILVTKTGFDSAKEHIAHHLNNEDLIVQKTMILNSFSIARKNRGTDDNEAIQLVEKPEPFTQEELRSHALKIVKRELDHLMQHAFKSKDVLFWPASGVTESNSWFVTTTALNNYNGLLGIGLTFLYAADLLNDPRYKEIALQCLHSTLSVINNKEHRNKIEQLGAYEGVGSILYALSIYYRKLKDPKIKKSMIKLLGLIPKLIKDDKYLDIIAGSAGLLVVLVSLQDILPKRKLIPLMQACVQHILKQYPTPKAFPLSGDQYGATQPLLGAAHGVSGILWALHQYNAFQPSKNINDWIQNALAYERDVFCQHGNFWPDFRESDDETLKPKDPLGNTSWCNGATGIGLTRLDMSTNYNDEWIEREINRALDLTLEKGFKNFPCLCHGSLGSMELLLTAYHKNQDPKLLDRYNELLTSIVATMDEKKFHYSPIAESAEPGLMTGRAGIAYQLMRMTFPEKVPSVLLLKPNSE